MGIITKALEQAERILKGVRANYVIVMPDGETRAHGNLELAPSKPTSGRRFKFKRKAERREFKKWLRPYLAMTKIMEPNPRGALYFNARTIQQAFIAKELFDPTPLCDYIMAKGINRVVDNVFPLGDIDNFNPPFKELP